MKLHSMLGLIVCVIAAIGITKPTKGDIIYQEDFEDGVADGLTTTGGSWSVCPPGLNGSNFGYHAESWESSFRIDGLPNDNFAMEADFQIANAAVGDFDMWLNTSAAPLWSGSDSGYYVMVNPVGSDNPDAWISRRDDSGPGMGLASTPNTINAGETRHLRVERTVPEIRVYLDGDFILSANDATYTTGSQYMRLYGGGVIDNILVTVPAPEPATLALLALGGLALIRRRR